MQKPIYKLLLILSLFASDFLQAYPYDGYLITGIRRLLRLQLVMNGELHGTKPPSGGQKSIGDMLLNLQNERGDSLASLPPVSEDFQKKIDALFPNRDESYSVSVLEVTPGKPVRYAERQADREFNPGSVGKLAIAAGLFTELQRLFPDAPEKRIELMRNRVIIADQWAMPNHHEVPVYNVETKAFAVRAVRIGDTFSLYEWTDHMLSASSNAAASTVWKEMLLMRQFGENYPPSLEQEAEFFKNTRKDSLKIMALSVVNDPLRAVGITENEWQLGSFFTATGQNRVPGARSYATPRALMKFLVAMERGKLVDSWSSLEIKRMLYLTARRIRYAASPRLDSAKVYFKSGSLYKCKKEEGFECGKYRGNVDNYMNSVAIVEHEDGRIYYVALMSNVLKKNSAVEHQSIATFIDKILSE